MQQTRVLINPESFDCRTLHLCGMKTVLVPTDFSPAGDTAVAYAVTLANATGSAVLLLHTYQLPVTMTDFPVLMIPVDDLRASSEQGLARMKEEAVRKHPGAVFQTESRMGDAVAEINLLAEERQALCVVWGAQRHSGLEDFLLGDDTLSLVRNSNYPVAVVHEGDKMNTPKNLLLAVDDNALGEVAAQTVARFVEALGASLHVVHVVTTGDASGGQNAPALSFAASHTTVNADDVASGIASYVAKTGADLLVVLPHRQNFFERLFSKSHTGDIMDEAKVPVLCIQA